MSTQPLQISKDTVSSKLYCQFHQPQISFTFLDVYGQNKDLANSFSESVITILVEDLYSVSPKCHYTLCSELLSTYLHMIRSNAELISNIKLSLKRLTDNLSWVNENN